ncbi:MAG: hypothetical protein JSV30_06150 [Candidatus Omnitrophota bacterium]|nr:MAG: hypothetical protein JSV30_06150 [Candidatus Omnitrophota bacterium]
MRRLLKRGQSVLEYVLVLSAIVAAILAVASTIKGNVKSSVEHAAGEMYDVIDTRFLPQK